jgi:hypothetical protein
MYTNEHIPTCCHVIFTRALRSRSHFQAAGAGFPQPTDSLTQTSPIVGNPGQPWSTPPPLPETNHDPTTHLYRRRRRQESSCRRPRQGPDAAGFPVPLLPHVNRSLLPKNERAQEYSVLLTFAFSPGIPLQHLAQKQPLIFKKFTPLLRSLLRTLNPQLSTSAAPLNPATLNS